MAGKKTGKRLLTWVLVLVMALSLLPLNALAKDVWSTEYGSIRIYLDAATNNDLKALKEVLPNQVRIVSTEYLGGMRPCAQLPDYWGTPNIGRKVTASKIKSIDLVGDKAIGGSNIISIPIRGNETYEVKVSEGDDNGLYLRIDISKRTPEPPKAPDAPNYDNLKTLIGDITVNCTNTEATHSSKSKTYALIEDSYTSDGVKGDAENGYTYTVTISSQKYAERFNSDTGAAHTPKDATATVTLEYKNNAWHVKSGTPIVFNVECNAQPELPTPATVTLSDAEGNSLIKKHLTVNGDGLAENTDFVVEITPKTEKEHGIIPNNLLAGTTSTVGTVTNNTFTSDFSFSDQNGNPTSLTFSAPGEYTFKVTEKNLGVEHMQYDDTEYTMTVNVTKDADKNKLNAAVSFTEDGQTDSTENGQTDSTDSITFNNTYTAPTYPVYVYAFFAHNGTPLKDDDVTVNDNAIEWNEDANKYNEYFVTLGVYRNGTTQKPTDGATGLVLKDLNDTEYEAAEITSQGNGTKNDVTLNDITVFPSPSGKVCKGAAGYPGIGEELSWHLDGQVDVYTVTYDDGMTEGEPTSAGYYFRSYTIADAPKRDGYTFTGWKDGDTTYQAGQEITLSKDLNLVAQWTAKEPDTVTINLSDYIEKNLTVTGNGFQGETFTVTVTGDSESGGGQFTGSVTYAANEGNASLKAFTDWKVVHSPTGDNYVFNDNGTITFKKVTTGTAYSFTVDEAKGGTEEMDYDGSSRSFNVWVGTDKESGKLKITKTSKPITLENHYNGTFPVALGQYIKKVYKSECSCAPETTFRFEALIEERVPEANALSLIESVPVEKESKVYTAKGSVTLKAGTEQTADMSIQLPKGFYEVTLKEVNDKTANVKYDKTVYTFGISVLEDGGNVKIGFFDVKKDGKEYNEQGFVFTNSYVHSHFIPVSPKHSKPTLNTGDHYAYVMGYPDGTVRPNGSITRAEVSTILFRLLSDKTRDEYFTTESSFTDVKAGAWYNNSIATLEKAGVIVDTAKGGAFRPNEAITRAELAAMLAQFSDAKPVKGVKFSDVSAGHWAYEAIAIAAKMGWIEGYPDGTFRPDATITRAEMMTLVNRALERVPSDEDHLLSKRVMLTFPDCKSGDWFYIAVQEATNSHTYERAATEKNGDEQWTALRANRDWTLLEK